MKDDRIPAMIAVTIFVFIAIVMLLFSSCRTGKVVVVEAKDSVRVEERVREIKVTDTLFVEVPMQKESTTVRDSMSHLENDYAISDARINPDGSLYHSLETKPRTDTLTQELSVQAKDSIIYREKVIPKIYPVEKELNWFVRMRIWLGNIMLVLISGAVIWLAARLFLKR
ncbi:MAG TPA: hypothetical protein DHU85_04050 [Porphyromonadaceae bacterium]|nr:hypothetical protein [Porphyromonadaceae bacterium]